MNDDTQERGFGEVAERDSGDETEEVNSQESVEDKAESTTETEQTQEATDNQPTEGETETKVEDKSEKPQITEKGTKLDPNPQSAIHQQLANERRIRSQMEQVLSSPELIGKFLKQQYGIDFTPNAKAEGDQVKVNPAVGKYTAKDFENLEDVADKFNQLQANFGQQIADRDKKIDDLNKQVTGINTSGRMQQIANTTESEVKVLRSEPELNPKSPDFIPGLEEQIGELYMKLDFDEESNNFRGKNSIKEIGDMLLKTAREARKAGVQKGQTIIKDKTTGKIRTTTTQKVEANKDEMSPGASIAMGVAKMFSR